MESPVRISLSATIVVHLLLLSNSNVQSSAIPPSTPSESLATTLNVNISPYAKVNSTAWVNRKPTAKITADPSINDIGRPEAISQESVESKFVKSTPRGSVRYNSQKYQSSPPTAVWRRPLLSTSTTTTNKLQVEVVTPTPEKKNVSQIIESMRKYKSTKIPRVHLTRSTTTSTERQNGFDEDTYTSDDDDENDYDISKFTSSEFHDEDNVSTFSGFSPSDLHSYSSKLKEKYSNMDFSKFPFDGYTSNSGKSTFGPKNEPYKEFTSNNFKYVFDNIDLTTPKNDFFDKRFTEISQSIAHNLERHKARTSKPENKFTSNIQGVDVSKSSNVEEFTNKKPSNHSEIYFHKSKTILVSDNEAEGSSLSDVQGTSIYFETSMLSTESYGNDVTEADCDNDTRTDEPTTSTTIETEEHLTKVSTEPTVFSTKTTEFSSVSTNYPSRSQRLHPKHIKNFSSADNKDIVTKDDTLLTQKSKKISSNDLSKQTSRIQFITPKTKVTYRMKTNPTTTRMSYPTTIYAEHFSVRDKQQSVVPDRRQTLLTTVSSAIDPVYETEISGAKKVVHSHTISDNRIPGLRKRGSTKFGSSTTDAPSPEDVSASFIAIPSASSSWGALAGMRNPPSPTSPTVNVSTLSTITKNVDENELQRGTEESADNMQSKTPSPSTIGTTTTINSNTINNQWSPIYFPRPDNFTTLSQANISPEITQANLKKPHKFFEPTEDSSLTNGWLAVNRTDFRIMSTPRPDKLKSTFRTRLENTQTSPKSILENSQISSTLPSHKMMSTSISHLEDKQIPTISEVENIQPSPSSRPTNNEPLLTTIPEGRDPISTFNAENRNTISPENRNIISINAENRNTISPENRNTISPENRNTISPIIRTERLHTPKPSSPEPLITVHPKNPQETKMSVSVTISSSKGSESITKPQLHITTNSEIDTATVADIMSESKSETLMTSSSVKTTHQITPESTTFNYVPASIFATASNLTTAPTHEEAIIYKDANTPKVWHPVLPDSSRQTSTKFTDDIPITTYRPRPTFTSGNVLQTEAEAQTEPKISTSTQSSITLIVASLDPLTTSAGEDSTSNSIYEELTTSGIKENSTLNELVNGTSIRLIVASLDPSTNMAEEASTSNSIYEELTTSGIKENSTFNEMVSGITSEITKRKPTTETSTVEIKTETTEVILTTEDVTTLIPEQITSYLSPVTEKSIISTTATEDTPVLNVTANESPEVTINEVTTIVREVDDNISPTTDYSLPTTEHILPTTEKTVDTTEDSIEDTTDDEGTTTRTVSRLEDLTSNFSEDLTTTGPYINTTSSSAAGVAIAVSTIGVITLLLLIALLLVLRRRRLRGRRCGVFAQRCTPVSLEGYSVGSVSMGHRKGNNRFRASKRSYGNPAYDDELVISHPMQYAALANFAQDVESMAAEFSEIPAGIVRADEVPAGCEDKNRYSNVLPLPETRVPLQKIEGDPTSDYINANYVTGPGNIKNYYIACQAPMANTVTDFWRMMWEQNSRVIVMLTEYMENGVEKCFEYLPPSEVTDNKRTFGDFQIILSRREQRDKYAVSAVQLKNLNTKTWREVYHLWYFWPAAKGVPDDYESVINFMSEMRSHMKISQNAKEFDEDDAVIAENGSGNLSKLKSDGSPSSGKGVNIYSPAKAEEMMRNGAGANGANGTLGRMKAAAELEGVRPCVVMCANGAGRTGAMIALDLCARAIEGSGTVDVPRTVRALRSVRPHALQNKNQYIFLYKVLSEYGYKLTGAGVDSL